jgi:hypothetical protein
MLAEHGPLLENSKPLAMTLRKIEVLNKGRSRRRPFEQAEGYASVHFDVGSTAQVCLIALAHEAQLYSTEEDFTLLAAPRQDPQ